MKRYALILVGTCVPVLVACSGGGSSSTTSTTSDLVANAATSATDTHNAAMTCFKDFQTCIDAAADDTAVAACQATLASCLPAQTGVGTSGLPDLCADDSGQDDGGKGAGHDCAPDGGMPGGDHRPPPPPAGGNGGAPGAPGGGGSGGTQGPPPGGPSPGAPGGGGSGGMQGPPPGGPGPGAPGGGPGHGGPGLPISQAGHIALATCHAELDKCLAAGTDKQTCVDTDHDCVHDALTADFTALCDAVATQCASCATSKACVALTQRCAAGLTLPDQPPTPPTH